MAPISFITVIKNRTHFTVDHEGQTLTLHLFETNLTALLSLVRPADRWEFVIVDFASDDVNMAEWTSTLPQKPNVTFNVVTVNAPFNKGHGLNLGKQAATHSVVFFLDADMLIRSRRIFEDIERHVVKARKVLFPICWSYSNPDHTEGWKRIWGVGNVVQHKDTVLPYVEKDSWGNEDYLNFAQFCLKGQVIRTYYGEDFIHQWHPNDAGFKNRFYAQTGVGKQIDTLTNVMTPQQIMVVNALLAHHV